MKDQLKVEDPARFLRDSGLLFELNRRVLHPVGLALYVKENEDGTIDFGGLYDGRHDAEGFVFDTKSFKEGEERFGKFCEAFALDRLEERLKKVGFIVQGETTEMTDVKMPEAGL